MSVKMKIKVTKEVLKASSMCGFVEYNGKIVPFKDLDANEQDKYELPGVTQNCGIALAIRELFPTASIGQQIIIPFSKVFDKGHYISASPCSSIPLPNEAKWFIAAFDDMKTPEERIAMPELEFEIDIPDDVLELLPIPDLSEYLKESKTLQLV